jgi:pimeloyl-ACP methyl ester carboxylesterase
MTSSQRTKIRFPSGDTTCAAWHYKGTNGACIIMAGGTGVTKEPASDLFGPRFNAAGYSVLAFDFRGFGESGGTPRQVGDIGRQQDDLEAAVACARSLPEVDPRRIVLWGFSLAGGHILNVAARDAELAAVILQAPLTDGQAAGRNALRSMTPRAAVALNVRGLRDVVGRLFGRAPVLVPLSGPRGTVASITTPDGQHGSLALNPGNAYPDWDQTIAAGSALRVAFYRPIRVASRVQCPLLAVAYDDDRTTLPGPAIRAGERAPRGEVVRRPGGHYAAFMEDFEQTLAIELEYLRRQLTEKAPARPAAALA